MEERVAQKLKYYYRMSYEFRLPLKAILMSVEFLEQEDSLNEEIKREALLCIQESAQLMNSLFNNALTEICADYLQQSNSAKESSFSSNEESS